MEPPRPESLHDKSVRMAYAAEEELTTKRAAVN
jgi:hypothetical protein